ncbi:MAG: DUF1553 domain-containing protein, partial [Verrucomicrobiae bacterium]|nr:DUF1553 domain-containing protein [Verrucomicrobiae bacterium]
MSDYYAVAGVFASVKMVDRPMLSEEMWAPVAEARAKVADLEKKLADLKKKKPAPDDLKAQTDRIGAEIAAIRKATPHYSVPTANGISDSGLRVLPADPKDSQAGTKLDYQTGEAIDLPVFERGDPNKPGEVVKRRFLAAFPASDGAPRRFDRGSGRLDLAEALTHEAAPLVARVMVNRVWRHHFGRGLVETPSEFGSLGDSPTHPELLDDLTARFVAKGWSLKWLHREILLSAAWRQSASAPESERLDPANRFLARSPRRRLDFESWRDAMLCVTGTLDPAAGGVATDLNDQGNRRRTLYGKIHRRELEPMLRLHDFPDPTAHSPKRTETTTPLQLLFTLNGPFLQEQAEALSARLLDTGKTGNGDRVGAAYRWLFQRGPTARERELAELFLGEGGEDRSGALTEYAQALLGSNEFAFLD